MDKETMEKLIKEKDALESMIKGLDEKVAAYEALGTPEEISSAFAKTEGLLSSLEDLGSIEDINRALDLSRSTLESYVAIGTPEQITESLKGAADFRATVESENLSREFGIDIGVARKMIDAHETFDKAKEMLSGLLSKKDSANESTKTTGEEVDPPVGSKVAGRISNMARNL